MTMETIASARVVVITGGNSGIGKAIAGAFHEDSRVVVIGRNEETLRATAAELGADAIWVKADISQREQVSEAITTIVRKYGVIHVLVNNAGFVRGASADMPLDEAELNWDAVIDTVLKGSYLMSVAAAPHLARPGGRIINIGSIAAYTGGSRGGTLAYAAAKAGLHGLTCGLARELSPQGITVNTIAPGFVAETGFTGQWPPERIQAIVAATPAGRPGRVDDIAAAVRFLASEQASFITGEVLNVNGGWLFGR